MAGYIVFLSELLMVLWEPLFFALNFTLRRIQDVAPAPASPSCITISPLSPGSFPYAAVFLILKKAFFDLTSSSYCPFLCPKEFPVLAPFTSSVRSLQSS